MSAGLAQRPGLCLVLAGVLAGVVMPALAQPLPLVEAPMSGVAVTRERAPLDGLDRPSRGATPLATPSAEVTTMLWASRSGLSAGIGVSQWTPGPPPLSALDSTAPMVSGRLVWGLSLQATRSAQIAWQRELVSPSQRPAFVLRPNDPYSELRRGLQLRMVVSRNTTVSVRPKSGGGVGVTLSSRW